MAKRQPLLRPMAIREVLQGLIKPLDWEHLGRLSRVREVWEQVVPPLVLPHTRLLDIRRRELWVEVSAGPWGQELQFLSPEIIKALTEALGPGVIQNLRIRVGTGR